MGQLSSNGNDWLSESNPIDDDTDAQDSEGEGNIIQSNEFAKPLPRVAAQITTTQLSPIEMEQVGPLSKLLGNVSIRWVLTIPFILQIIAVVGVVGYLSFLNGRNAVENLLGHLQSEIGDRVSQRLHDYLETPHHITRMNQRAHELGFLDVQDLERMQKYFHQQMEVSRSLSYVNFGNVDGSFVGVGRDDDGNLYGEHIRAEEPGLMLRYALDDDGNPSDESEEIAYEPREDAWYTGAVEAQRPLWTDIYQWPDEPEISSISASYPVYADPATRETLVGVLGADFIVSQVNQFLVDLVVSRNDDNSIAQPLGHVFIVERESGLLVASSNQASILEEGTATRIQAAKSPEPLIRATASYLQESAYSFASVTEKTRTIPRVQLLGDRQYIRMIPWSDNWGLDWVIVVVVPESVFMDQIRSNTRNTLLLCALALAIAIGIGIRTASWITQPILFLNKAAKNLADGAWNQAFVLERSDEVGELAQSFNDMARQIRHSFRDLEAQKDSFARFFPSEYLTFLDKTAVTDVRLGDHVSREMTVMFTDIRGFTSMSETMTPGETFDFVNTYLEEVAPAVRFHNGVIVKFLGDGTMAVFPESADSAVNAGIDTFQCLQTYNQRRLFRNQDPIQLGIGIHVGHMMVGIVGERTRMQADALSDTVNLTARLEGLTKFYGVSLLISDSVVNDLVDPNEYQLRFLGEAIVKGRSEPIGIYEVVDVESDAEQILKRQTLDNFQQGVTAYRSGDLEAAKTHFDIVLSIHPQDQPAQRFLHQIQEHVDHGQPTVWDGVWTFTQK